MTGFSLFTDPALLPDRRRVLAGLGALGVAAAAPALAATEQVVRDDESLSRAIKGAKPGTTIRLAPGSYGRVVLKGLRGTAEAPIVVTSDNPEKAAAVRGLLVQDCAFVVLLGLVFDYRFREGHKRHFRPFYIREVDDVLVRACLFDGDDLKLPGNPADGHGWAFGLSLLRCNNARIEGNTFRNFGRGLLNKDCHGLNVIGNRLHGMRIDGMNFSLVSRVRIEGNHLHDFRRDPKDKGHSDMIQFWTNKTQKPSRDIVIRRNLLNSGRGPFTQSIFMRNEEADTGRAGQEMYYRNLLIEENVIINAHLHGISVGETIGLTIRNNTLIRNGRSEGPKKNRNLYTPQIRVKERSENVEVLRNVTHKVPKPQRLGGWDIRDNALIQDVRPGVSNHYDALFVDALKGDPDNLDNFRYRRGGALDGAGLGASWLQPKD